MNVAQRDWAKLALELHAAFDATFASSRAAEPPTEVDLLQITVGGHGYVLRLGQVLSVQADRKLVSAPARRPELLGLVGVRGVVAPVYDLRRLLGYPAAAAPRWLALVRAADPFAVGFELFEHHLRVPLHDLMPGTGGDAGAHRFTAGSVKRAAGPLPVLDLSAIHAEVTSGVQRASALSPEERS